MYGVWWFADSVLLVEVVFALVFLFGIAALLCVGLSTFLLYYDLCFTCCLRFLLLLMTLCFVY